MIDFLESHDFENRLDFCLEPDAHYHSACKEIKRYIEYKIKQRDREAIEFTVRLFFTDKQKYESPESVDKAFEKIYGLWKAQKEKGGKDE